MCGRYAIYGPHSQRRAGPAGESPIDLFVDELAQHTRYNIAPSTDVPVIALRDGEPVLEVLRWGLKADGKPFNIRDDSADKPWAKGLLKTRVVFPLSGFYEWQAQEAGPKRPYLFVPAQDPWLAIAGVLGVWDGPGVSMMTTSANRFMKPYHHRMPVLLEPDAVRAWLDPSLSPAEVRELLRPAPDDLLAAMEVSRAVNSSRNQGAALIEPVNSA